MDKRISLGLLLTLCMTGGAQAQDTLWISYADRFKPNDKILLTNVDSMLIGTTKLTLYDATAAEGYRTQTYTALIPTDEADMTFAWPGRYLLKPSTYGGTDYTNDQATSGYNFAHSVESDHYAVFWDVRFGENATRIQHADGGSVANANSVLSICEKCWNTYVGLGFLVPGNSTTDQYKIQLYIPYQTDWRADASGTWGVNGGLTGIGHFNPWAASSRGGMTVAHEVAHTFQFLVHADLGSQHGFDYGYGDGASGGNGWWESCANWQAYKVFPGMQFTDGEYFEGHLPLHHLNLMHEAWRYQNCFIQDYWCMKHGSDFIGRLWRESIKPEDPVEAYKRMNGLTQAQFNDEQMEGYMRMATWDIDGVRDAAKHRIGQHRTHLHLAAGNDGTWEVDSAYCPQNYGYNIINMKKAATGTVVKADFKGIAGQAGYRKVNVGKAGWRYGFVALTTSGERVYGDVQSAKEGTATLTIPANCERVFFVVMGAPTEHWRHPWDDNVANDEQWPYQVKFENTNVVSSNS